ncbi:YidC family membrane integrase SpoIIIJ [Lentibacillus sediminis]|uniref:YidC family membrane integrase SpoIIIJ n=1 Tax=Lentibacillus sediminis TaxID=1940529 RepID=UPI000C1C65BA|nr:YidC family membrane integrase SpoIIIJ [Lentibacillus sediminis]
MRKKYILLLTLMGMVALLSGCMQIEQPITSESEGIWNTIFVYPLSWLIAFFADLFVEGYGLAIIIVTILIRLVLLPLNVKQLKSSRAMQEIQPELKELQKKYSSKDANSQQKLQQETMALFQKNGVNPLAGCLPIIVQMPILIAMYHAIMRTEAIQTHSFLWFELGAPDPYFILPLLTAFFTFLQSKLMMANNRGMSQNPQMQAQMTIMLWVMPIMIGVFAFIMPAALAVYWIVGNIFMIAQTLLINKPMMTANPANGGDKK